MPSTLRLSVLPALGDNARASSALHGGRAALWRALLRTARRAGVALLLALLPVLTQADVIEASDARIDYQDGGFELAANFEFDLPAPLEDALNKGISLYFVVDFQLSRPRWYWFDEKPVNTSRNIRLSYHPLTRQYRISTGGLQLPFTRLKAALQFIQRVRGWRVFERNAVRLGETYQAEVRMRLDLTQLPKPFQINAVNTRDWNLASDWRRFNYTVPTELNAAPPASVPGAAPAPALPVPAPAAPAASATVSGGETRAQPLSQTVSTALSPALLVQPPAQSQP